MSSPLIARPIVYFIADGAGAIKIGYTKFLPKRLSNIQMGLSRPLELVASVEGTEAHEKEVHKRLSKHKCRGEWFVDCPEVRAFAADLTKHGVASLNLGPQSERDRVDRRFFAGIDLGPEPLESSDRSLRQIFKDIDTGRLSRAFAEYEQAKSERIALEVAMVGRVSRPPPAGKGEG